MLTNGISELSALRSLDAGNRGARRLLIRLWQSCLSWKKLERTINLHIPFAVYGTDFPTMDITKVHAEDLNICDTNAFTYLLTHSLVRIYQLLESKQE